jgi:hypothetical protein
MIATFCAPQHPERHEIQEGGSLALASTTLLQKLPTHASISSLEAIVMLTSGFGMAKAYRGRGKME